jgi:hypothetical protein
LILHAEFQTKVWTPLEARYGWSANFSLPAQVNPILGTWEIGVKSTTAISVKENTRLFWGYYPTGLYAFYRLSKNNANGAKEYRDWE